MIDVKLSSNITVLTVEDNLPNTLYSIIFSSLSLAVIIIYVICNPLEVSYTPVTAPESQ